MKGIAVAGTILTDMPMCRISGVNFRKKPSPGLVSNEGADFYGKVVPSLKFCDYAVMNEIEACSVAGLDARDKSGKLIMVNLYKALENLDCA